MPEKLTPQTLVIMAVAVLSTVLPPKQATRPVDRPAIAKRAPCEPPKRWVEVRPLADDAGEPSPLVCK